MRHTMCGGAASGARADRLMSLCIMRPFFVWVGCMTMSALHCAQRIAPQAAGFRHAIVTARLQALAEHADSYLKALASSNLGRCVIAGPPDLTELVAHSACFLALCFCHCGQHAQAKLQTR